MTLLVVFLCLILVLAVLLVIPRKSDAAGESTAIEDAEELARAEEDLADIDALTPPEEATEELPDWGPGAPKYHKRNS
ncbi:MAG: hypothetical protein JSW51_06245 [Gemmatimonadota bacterium]|nr:MAG: hypothetical protein JSW51_06245 [Gemmatimonadota bacterium]